MASLTTTINGINATISPAVRVANGPSGQPAEFQSQPGTGVSQPVTITLAQPVSSFSITIVGQSYNPHMTTAYDADGKILVSIPTSAGNPDMGGGGGVNQVSINQNGISKVVLTPPPADYVAYRGIGSEALVAPTPPKVAPQPVLPPKEHTALPEPPRTARASKVSEMYTISPTDFSFDTKYVIGQQQIIPSFVYQFKNITSNTELVLTVKAPSYMTVNIEPSTLVKPGQEISVVFEFNKENATNQFIANRQELFTEQAQWSIKPVNVTGPVYIPL